MPGEKPTLDYVTREAQEEGHSWAIVVLATFCGIIVFFLLVALLLPLAGIVR